MLGFFFRHYDPIVQRYIVFDDGSTDQSLDLLRRHPKVDLRPMPEPSHPDSYVASAATLFSHCWKESRGRADWVIVTDIDEHLYHPQLEDYLTHCSAHGVSLVPARGYQMVAEEFPPESCVLTETCTMGAPNPGISKLSILAPDRIREIEFMTGRHGGSFSGEALIPAWDEVLLLHYKYLGFENTLRRYQQYNMRRKPLDLARGWGFQYEWSAQQLRESWTRCAARLVDVMNPDLTDPASYPGHPWWGHFPRATEPY